MLQSVKDHLISSLNLKYILAPENGWFVPAKGRFFFPGSTDPPSLCACHDNLHAPVALHPRSELPHARPGRDSAPFCKTMKVDSGNVVETNGSAKINMYIYIYNITYIKLMQCFVYILEKLISNISHPVTQI